MGLSLQDQLLKAGIADKKQAKKAKHEKRVKQKKNKDKKVATETSDPGSLIVLHKPDEKQ